MHGAVGGNTPRPYEILAPLGAGGMGGVYQATDTKLGREVAIKVLPTEVAQNPERLAHFQREATLLAALKSIGSLFVAAAGGRPLGEGPAE